jgi:hypothetical protein
MVRVVAGKIGRSRVREFLRRSGDQVARVV